MPAAYPPERYLSTSTGSSVLSPALPMAILGLILLVILPILAMGFGAWDGVKEGFSLLWLLAPFVCFLAPMYLFLNDSALIYGVGYSLLGFGAHSVGAFIHARRARGV